MAMNQCHPSMDQNAEARRELLEQILRLRTLVDAAFEGIGVCCEGIIVDVNEQLTLMLGYTRSELIGMPVARFVAPESRELVRQAIQSGQTDSYEHLAIRKDGTVFPVEVRSRMHGTGTNQVRLTAVRDITERKKAERALRESEERFRAVVDCSPECIAVAVDERVAYLNPAGRRLFGFGNSTDLTGHSVYDFVPPAFHEEIRTRRQGVLELGLTAEVKEGQLLRADGSPVAVEAMAVPFVYAGQPAILNIIRDISERKRLERERAEALIREQKAREEFTRKLIASQEAERRRIAAELHDSLGQNLLLIKNRAQLALLGGAGSADANAQLEEISALANAAISEVRQISHDLHPYQLDHLGLTGALEAMIDNAARSSGVTFERKLDRVDEVFAKDGATNLYRVVQESLSNVLKHSRARHGRVRLERDVREIILRISDDGLGFDAAQSENHGLGLRNIAERVRILGGRLALNSSVQRGTCVEVTIPIPSGE